MANYFRIIICCLLALPVVARAAESPFYETEIRPIFKAACFHCHGEEEEIEGSLDLRLRRSTVQGGDSGEAIVVGDPDSSLLLERIVSGEMPPGKAKLKPAEIELIRVWIRTGAKTAEPEPEDASVSAFSLAERNFWSLQPILKPDVPDVADSTRVRTPIDAFVLARLEKEKLNFAPDADRRTLIRRLSFDLIGLPPTPEEVKSFLADTEPGAYERLVDRLLESPHYGERWGRHWLDVAGYADSEGFNEADTERPSGFRYRDYVIRSFNADKPFDLFIQEQLAGDEMVTEPLKNLSPESVEKLTATGFLRMAPDGTGAGGAMINLARNQVVSETLKIVSTSLLGLTVGCAECHHHRYDPILQTDYYSLRAIFEPALNWKKWRTPAARKISLYTDEDRSLAVKIEAEAKVVDAERAALAKVFIDLTLDSQLLKLEEAVREPLKTAYKTKASERTDEQKALLDKYPKILKISDGSLYLYDREIRTDAAKIKAEHKQKEKEFVAQAFTVALADLSKEEQAAIRSTHATAVAKRTAEQKTLLETHADKLVTAATLEKFNTTAAEELKHLKQSEKDLLATLKADRLKAIQEKANKVRDTKPHEGFLRALTEVHGQVPETFLFNRGDFEQPKQKLVPAGLSVLDSRELVSIPENNPELPTTGRRLAFAKRLTDGRHPLTARVLVNRFWLNHFGRGIVETPGDFGYLGARPSHPELLDWLANEFLSNGWKLKQLHKLMVTSTTYRQSSQRSARQDEVDPDNHLYGHMSIHRIDAETLRDTVLAISGKLNRKLYGEPVPVTKDSIGRIIIGEDNLDGERKPLAAIDMKGEQFRRSIYIQVRRSRPLGVLATFDMPVMEPNCTSRNSSTVTPQALMLMNSDFSSEFAGIFAQRVSELAKDDPLKQCQHAWELAFGREPTASQIETSVAYLKQQKLHYEKSPQPKSKQTPDQLALKSFCQALISSNAFLYVD